MNRIEFLEEVELTQLLNDEEAIVSAEDHAASASVVMSFVCAEFDPNDRTSIINHESTVRAIFNGAEHRLECGDFVGPYFFDGREESLRGIAVYRKQTGNNA